MDWGRLPDLVVFGVMASAFASVARRRHTSVSALWLTGWMLVVAHFAALLFAPLPGIWGTVAADFGLSALVGAGLLFMLASIPYRHDVSSRWMTFALLGVSLLYIVAVNSESTPGWAMTVAALLVGVVPFGLAVSTIHRICHPLRWLVVGLYAVLSVFLLNFQNLPDIGRGLALNGLLFTVYLGCCLFLIYSYRLETTGAQITVFGFIGWAAVFVAVPVMTAVRPDIHVESGVWNLPKFIVAVGMILLLLEEQIEHNKYLALHDELTGLPNRRLFLDRLSVALERARRAGSKAALLVVDLDHFKQVNDTLGHHAGDQLLQQVGEIFLNRVRRSDTVARTGGDEFSFILEEPINALSAAQVARSLAELLNQPLRIGEHNVHVGASIGLAIFPDDATEKEALCIAADLRMYDKKHSPRGDESDKTGGPDTPSSVIEPIAPLS